MTKYMYNVFWINQLPYGSKASEIYFLEEFIQTSISKKSRILKCLIH